MKETKKLYDSISDIDDRFIEEAREEVRKAPAWRKWAGLAACLCVAAVIFAAALYPWGEGGAPVTDPNGGSEIDPGPDRSPSTDNIPVRPNEDNDKPGADPLEPPEPPVFNINWEGVAVNESEGLSAAEAPKYYDPEIYISETWGQEEVVAYYGWNLAPAYIPEGLTGGGHGVSTGIWRERATGEIVQDQAGRGFWTAFGEDRTPKSDDELDVPTGFTIRASKLRILHCGLLPVDDARTTDFGGVSVTLNHFSVKYGPNNSDTYDIYTASFTSKGVKYEIEAQRLKLEEVIKIVASTINMLPYSEDFTVGSGGAITGGPAVTDGSTITVTYLFRGGPGEFAGDMYRPEGVNKNIGSALVLKMSVTDDDKYSVLIRIPEGSTLERALSRANESLNMAINADDAVTVNISGEIYTAADEYFYRLTTEQIVALAESGTQCFYVGSGQGDHKDVNWDTKEGINAYCELNGDMYVLAGDGIEAHPDIWVEE